MKIANLGSSLALKWGCAAPRPLRMAGSAILAGGMLFAGTAGAATLFEENFEGVTPLLQPFFSETRLDDGDGTDWISLSEAQAAGRLSGWGLDLTTTPTDGVPEFQGWTLLDPSSWTSSAGQNRGDFSLGQGTIAVADGDEYDDQPNNTVGADNINVFLRTPAINLTTAANRASATLIFDSSFRPYAAQTGLVDVSFDGGATFKNLVTLDTANSGGNSSLSRVNETISVRLGATPTTNSAIIRFGYTKADNDWWWAIDNLRVIEGDATASLTINRDTGQVTFTNSTTEPLEISGYSVISTAGALNAVAWKSVDDNYDVSGNKSVDPTNEWIEFSAADSRYDLSEGTLASATLAVGESVDLGLAWTKYFDSGDVRFEYVSDGQLVQGTVLYTGTEFPAGDLNFDGSVTGADWSQFVTRLGSRGIEGTPAQTYSLGDLDGDGDSDHGDFVAFRTAYDAANGAGAFLAMASAIPEPSAAALVLGAGLCGFSRRRR